MPNVTDVVIRITADANQAQRVMNSLGKGFGVGGISGSGAFLAASGALEAGMVAIGSKAITVSEQFNSSFSGVQRTINETNSTSFADIKSGLLDMSTRLPLTAKALAEVATSGGEMGIGADKILQFTEVVGKMSLYAKMGPDELAESLGRLSNITGETDLNKLGSEITAVANQTVGGVRDLFDGMQRLAMVGHLVGLSVPEIAAWSGAMNDAGISAEMGGSALSRVFMQMKGAGAGITAGRGPLGDIQDIMAKREGGERLSDLQDNLDVAQEHRGEMFTKRGRLKKGIKPSELARTDKQIARMQREVQDAKDDLEAATPEGRRGAFAELAGESTNDFSAGIKDNPSETMQKVIGGLGNRSPEATLKLLRRAGINNIRDVTTLSALAANPDDFKKLLSAGMGQSGVTTNDDGSVSGGPNGGPSALDQSAATKLVTDLAHQAEINNTLTKSMIEAGDKLAPQWIEMEQKGLEALKHAEGIFGGVDHMVDAAQIMFGLTLAAQAVMLGKGALGMFGKGGKGPGLPNTSGLPANPADWTPEDLARIKGGGLGQKAGQLGASAADTAGFAALAGPLVIPALMVGLTALEAKNLPALGKAQADADSWRFGNTPDTGKSGQGITFNLMGDATTIGNMVADTLTKAWSQNGSLPGTVGGAQFTGGTP